MKYRKKPVVIDAIQFVGGYQNRQELMDLFGSYNQYSFSIGTTQLLVINTLEGSMIANELDWIIKGVNGEFYPCKPDIFEKTYEPVNDGYWSVSQLADGLHELMQHSAPNIPLSDDPDTFEKTYELVKPLYNDTFVDSDD